MVKSTREKALVSIAFMAPALFLFCVLFIYPIISGFAYSFTNWDGLETNPRFVGFKNYLDFFHEQNALDALRRTLLSTVIIVLVQNGIALLVAAILDGNIRGAGFFKTVYYFPAILSSVIVGYLWTFILDPLNGLLAGIQISLGGPSLAVNFLGDPRLALYAVCGVLIWQYFGYSMVIYLSGLQTVPVEHVEAADMDGASAWQKFWRIKFPLIAPAFTINMVISVIGALKVFDHIYVLTKGGPGRATETLTFLIYREAFGANRMGYGSAVSIILLVMIMILATIEMKLLQKRELEG